MRINDQRFNLIFLTTLILACEVLPDEIGEPESQGSTHVETYGMSSDGPTSSGDSSGGSEICPASACTRCDALAAECQNTPGCDVIAALASCGQTEIHCGCPSDTCSDASLPTAGELYGPCNSEHACNDGLICQVADDPDPQFPKGTICLPTCWGEGNDGSCPEALDSCGEPFAKTTCQSETDPQRAVPCIMPCAADIDCPAGLRCFLDRCVWSS